MAQSLENVDSRLHFFAELLSYNSNCYLWSYAPDGTLLSTNCPDLVLDKVFQHSSCYQYLLDQAQTNMAPLIMSSVYGLVWGAVFEQNENGLERMHVLGPALTQTLNHAELERAIWGKISPQWKPKYMKIMEKIPVISYMMFAHRVLMMQFCVTGDRIRVSDIVMQRAPRKQASTETAEPGDNKDRIQVHMAERALLDRVRNGDINYGEALEYAAKVLTGKRPLSRDALQHTKLGQVQFVALCCNAAIEGGLSPETAYTRKDAYIQDVENAKSITEITQIGKTMYEDYIQLVHNQRINLSYSKAIQSTCNYIENHLGENLSAEALAKRVGYSAYYLSRVFKKETGFTIDEYTRNVRIERAKSMLSSSSDSIQEIAEALGFGGRNYFAVTFKKVTGIPPAAYRKNHQHL